MDKELESLIGEQKVLAFWSNCLQCTGEFLHGYRGLWCRKACWRVGKVLSRQEIHERIEPSREKLEAVYGKDTPQFKY